MERKVALRVFDWPWFGGWQRFVRCTALRITSPDLTLLRSSSHERILQSARRSAIFLSVNFKISDHCWNYANNVQKDKDCPTMHNLVSIVNSRIWVPFCRPSKKQHIHVFEPTRPLRIWLRSIRRMRKSLPMLEVLFGPKTWSSVSLSYLKASSAWAISCQ